MSPFLLGGIQVWAIALAMLVVVLTGLVFGSVARLLLRGRARLGLATSVVIGILGCAAGLLLAWWIDPDVAVWSLLSVTCSLGVSVLAIGAYGAVAAHFQRPQLPGIADLLAAGESDRVEFKSTARVNLRTGARDERMEQVVAKTVCGYLNGEGGSLLIGVDDTGTPLGLEADLATLKSPDVDRYELWLRDLLMTCLGQAAAAGVGVRFHDVPGEEGVRQVCQVSCEPSPRPVYLRPAKGAAPELWLRSGNSTRQLSVDQATEYVMHRWPLSFGASTAAQFRAAVRFSESR